MFGSHAKLTSLCNSAMNNTWQFQDCMAALRCSLHNIFDAAGRNDGKTSTVVMSSYGFTHTPRPPILRIKYCGTNLNMWSNEHATGQKDSNNNISWKKKINFSHSSVVSLSWSLVVEGTWTLTLYKRLSFSIKPLQKESYNADEADCDQITSSVITQHTMVSPFCSSFKDFAELKQGISCTDGISFGSGLLQRVEGF